MQEFKTKVIVPFACGRKCAVWCYLGAVAIQTSNSDSFKANLEGGRRNREPQEGMSVILPTFTLMPLHHLLPKGSMRHCVAFAPLMSAGNLYVKDIK